MEGKIETERELYVLTESLRLKPNLIHKTHYFQQLNQPFEFRRALVWLVFYVILAFLLWLSLERISVVPLEIPVPMKSVCGLRVPYIERPEVGAAMLVAPFMALFFTIYAKDSEIRIQADWPDFFLQMAGAVISFILHYLFILCIFTFVLLVTPLCQPFTDFISSFRFLEYLYRSFFVTISGLISPLLAETKWISFLAIISVVYLFYVGIHAVFTKQYVKLIGFSVIFAMWNFYPNGSVNILLVYLFFHTVEHILPMAKLVFP